MSEQDQELIALANINFAMQMKDVSPQNKVEYALSALQKAEPLTLPASIKLKDLLNKTIESGAYEAAVQRCNATFAKIISNENGLGLELFGGNTNPLQAKIDLKSFTDTVNSHKHGHNHEGGHACGVVLSPTEINNQAEAYRGNTR